MLPARHSQALPQFSHNQTLISSTKTECTENVSADGDCECYSSHSWYLDSTYHVMSSDELTELYESLHIEKRQTSIVKSSSVKLLHIKQCGDSTGTIYVQMMWKNHMKRIDHERMNTHWFVSKQSTKWGKFWKVECLEWERKSVHIREALLVQLFILFVIFYQDHAGGPLCSTGCAQLSPGWDVAVRDLLVLTEHRNVWDHINGTDITCGWPKQPAVSNKTTRLLSVLSHDC